ncbi:hypothetical protein [Achromobacter pestifer]|uniref:hypothetical protein n=1 Tax=Achromobacter pestifer TaxID=1353889 RepID=UPI00158196A5|nr:hypothetical protein [Achromobacter pestifer]
MIEARRMSEAGAAEAARLGPRLPAIEEGMAAGRIRAAMVPKPVSAGARVEAGFLQQCTFYVLV